MNKNIEPLTVEEVLRMLKFAMTGIGEELRKVQDNIILEERFGRDAVDYPSSYNPSRYEEYSLADRIRRYNNLLEFSKKVQTVLDYATEVDTKKWAESVKEYFNKTNKR